MTSEQLAWLLVGVAAGLGLLNAMHRIHRESRQRQRELLEQIKKKGHK